ncbi:helix-turn-helix domain-containing protein [Pedobacter rhodius]|uniref:Helix-turn-helix transcriptional regulator n=1 Tax=Pedobacter rhodius TaxID=3004098 RepID=A0ABT4KZ87_9SPHI|nr:helix-turn-helix transcriptional regulator [Pedobacter sp. SJ11]MCZ4224253.1 helix-turn-helix transcriptional regulator [Pedobacter sp. SJ11]
MKSKKLTRLEMKQVFSYENLRKFRDEKCYSQEYIAKLLNVEQSTYQRIESGRIKITMDRLIKLAAIFKKPIQSFSEQENESINEIELMKKIISQQEKRIVELEAKVNRKNLKIDELKKIINIK